MSPIENWFELLRDRFPLARAMGVRVAHYDGRGIALEAPLASNQNHHGSAFSGSLYALADMAGFGLLHTRLVESGIEAEVFMRAGEVDYRRPVLGDLVARCTLPEGDAWDDFLTRLEERGRARLELSCTIAHEATGETEAAAVLTGHFMAMRPA
ncbi:MAG: YiiD C-terminal domain-containing protein [Gammaproteobacteria bacterium]